MRHYSCHTNPNVVTYNVNGSEYVSELQEELRRGTERLAEVLEIPLGQVIAFLRNLEVVPVQAVKPLEDDRVIFGNDAFCVLSSDNSNAEYHITPAEMNVLASFKLFTFELIAQDARGLDVTNGARSTCFHYANLNEGTVFTWVNLVC